MKKTYKVILEKRVKKDLKPVPNKDRVRIFDRIYSLAKDPYPKGYTKLENYKPTTFRVRRGKYRILYRVNEGVIEIRVVAVGHRSGIYK